MRYTLLAILLLVAPRGAVALTWDFADGSTWGWAAWEGDFSNRRGHREPLKSEIVDGVWRIAPVSGFGIRPTVQLRSPLIGKDSALFDPPYLTAAVSYTTAPLRDNNSQCAGPTP